MSAERVARIRMALAVLEPQAISIRDDSHKHAGHAGARDGRGHFALTLVSAQFENMSPVKRHQLIYAALGALLQSDIHALAIQAQTPAEAARLQQNA